MQVELLKPDSNGRVYPPEAVREAVSKWDSNFNLVYFNTRMPWMSVNDVVGSIVDVRFREDGSVHGNFKLLQTPKGRALQEVIEAGATLRYTMCGLGHTNEDGTVRDFTVTHVSVSPE